LQDSIIPLFLIASHHYAPSEPVMQTTAPEAPMAGAKSPRTASQHLSKDGKWR